MRDLRISEDARPVLVEHLHGRRSSAVEGIISTGEGNMKFGLIAAGSEVGVHAPQRRWRVDAPAGIVDRIGREIAGQVADFAAGFDGCAHPTIGAAAHFGIDAVVREAVLHLERKRTANRVEAENWIAGIKGKLTDGILWDEIPIDDVAEDLVDAHSVLIDGKP